MSNSIEKTRDMLIAAKAATEQARNDLAKTEAVMKDIEDIHLEVKKPFFKTQTILDQARENIARMNELKERMSTLDRKISGVKQGIEDIEALELKFESFLKEISRLDREKQFDEGLARADEMLALAKSYDFGEPLGIQRIVFEVAEWTKVGLLTNQAEDNIQNEKLPFEEGKFQEYLDRIEKLPLGIHEKKHIEAFRDVICGFKIMDRVFRSKEQGNSLENIMASLELLKNLEPDASIFSQRTKDRARYLYLTALDQYNYLSADAFDARREYGDAKELFAIRDSFKREDILHPDYRDAVDEPDFHLRFLRAEALRQDDEAFMVATHAYAASIQNPEEFEQEVLAQYLVLDGLDDSKVNILMDAVEELPFPLVIELLSGALSQGLDLARQEQVLNIALGKKDKSIELEKYAKALLNCRDLLDVSLQKPFDLMLKDLLRSPAAHKICVKSPCVELHALYGEDKDHIRMPLGKPAKKTVVKPWDFLTKGMYFGLGIVLPLLLLSIAEVVLYFALKDLALCPYILTAAPILMMLVGHFAIVARHGRDERGSIVFRRILVIDGMWKGLLSLGYFALPTTFEVIKPFALTLIIVGAVEGIFALFAYKEKRKGPAIALFLLWFLCEGASLAFLILGLMNGTI